MNKDGDSLDIPADAFAVESTDPATGIATLKIWGLANSQLRTRMVAVAVEPAHLKVFAMGRARVEAIGEVFNLFNAINPSNIVAGVSANRTVYNATTGARISSLLQPASFSGDSQRPEQRVGQIGLRFTF